MSAPAESIPLFHPTRTVAMEQAALDVLRSGQIATGPAVPEFERAFGEIVGSAHVVATSDMTSALVLALRLAGVQRGDEVATLAFSCLSSNSPIAILGARARWIDVDAATLSMDPVDLAHQLTPKTRAVMVYHVAGYPARMAEIAAICRARGIALIEDCNNALGASLDGGPVGRHADYAIYSFYPNRQINALEGGALVCPDADTAARARRLRRFGIDTTTFRDDRGEINAASDVPEMGWSASFGHLNAAMALAQLSDLPDHGRRTAANAARLAMHLRNTPGIRVVTPVPGAVPAYWGFLIFARRRDELLAALKLAGIRASVLHHRNDDYSGFQAERRDLSGTTRVMEELIALPCGWWLDDAQIDRLATTVIAESQRLR